MTHRLNWPDDVPSQWESLPELCLDAEVSTFSERLVDAKELVVLEDFRVSMFRVFFCFNLC